MGPLLYKIIDMKKLIFVLLLAINTSLINAQDYDDCHFPSRLTNMPNFSARHEGVVIFAFTVLKSGKVKDVYIFDSSTDIKQEIQEVLVRDFVNQARFEVNPNTCDESSSSVKITFKLR